MAVNTIDDVIKELEAIVAHAESAGSTSGYFAALYLKVTRKVKEGIETGFFDDGPRMEKLDVVFAKRYLDALHHFKAGNNVSESWNAAFKEVENDRLIVLQHLLLGMNAHINLDLGIAAAEISQGKNLNDLQNDFNRINDILSSLTHQVQASLTKIWPPLKWLLSRTGNTDRILADFSMKLARDGAWKFAGNYYTTAENEKPALLAVRDKIVAQKADLVTTPGKWANFLLRIVRLTERGTVSEKIKMISAVV